MKVLLHNRVILQVLCELYILTAKKIFSGFIINVIRKQECIMQVQKILFQDNKISSNTNFKSVYPVYHWFKPKDKYVPATSMQYVKHFQRLVVSILNKKSLLMNVKSDSFLKNFVDYIASKDIDYKYTPYVRSFYNSKGGLKRDSNGIVYDIEPNSYILTGQDAVYFENLFGKPINYVIKESNIQETEIKRLVAQAKRAYASKGLKFVKEKQKLFVDKQTSRPLELHTIFKMYKNDVVPRLYKAEFFEKNAKNNPLITNDII